MSVTTARGVGQDGGGGCRQAAPFLGIADINWAPQSYLRESHGFHFEHQLVLTGE